ncbi:leucine-rich repeat domain-containing protein [Glaesserella parasuis]|nr:leucine-rich repeat domain-containing protein [Glaesserella parasuis]MDP0141410.1 leucine-rich repeat domain-containing protein [Glaesserella parasuis]
MTNLPIIKKNTEIQKINKNLSIVNRLLPTVELQSSFNKLAWWNTLSQGWKYVFWGELNISEIEFNKKPDFYLEKLFNTTTELWFDYDLVDFYKIQDISPLGNLTQLTTLMFWGGKCQIQDISALGNLIKLKKLYLSENKIQNISSLGNLTQLTSLDLEYNQIRDISPLVKLENLETLYLKGNPITQLDIDWLQSKLPNCKINSEDDDY